MFAISAVVGPIADAGYGKWSFLTVLGMFIMSLCHEYWQVFLAQALAIARTGLWLPSNARTLHFPSSGRARSINRTAFRDPPYILLDVGLIFGSWASTSSCTLFSFLPSHRPECLYALKHIC
ncbi:hypothetical protein BO86DRAFT_97625 [Aspergillus japonicus CBS 114.51]|uniref:Uncharacterized protein n=1 Tax=Aspergillus japonicus CBS 114.51 TaxID=1448312 RepID=A0A8T8X034_ASPJA|nr:hypothetical protein BO86DRAFT_97625 [Aspergillus japonicus CBS 114.51]RAH81453.1 hypothetical protein BO86DRAFT_97625 [Aspergillus japonicus CBS 114.51]